MVPYSVIFNAASALTAIGIVLVLANWYAKPEAALAWAAALAISVVMVAALRVSQRALREQLDDDADSSAPNRRGELRFFTGGGAWLVLAALVLSIAALVLRIATA